MKTGSSTIPKDTYYHLLDTSLLNLPDLISDPLKVLPNKEYSLMYLTMKMSGSIFKSKCKSRWSETNNL